MLIVPLHSKAKTDPDDKVVAGFYGQPEDHRPAPARVSVATFDTDFASEPLHYSAGQPKLYITHSGEAVIEVNGQELIMNPEQMIVVDPGERHRIVRVITRISFTVVMMGPVNDKVVVQSEK